MKGLYSRYLDSLLRSPGDGSGPPARGRYGYSFGERYWASLTRTRLPLRGTGPTGHAGEMISSSEANVVTLPASAEDPPETSHLAQGGLNRPERRQKERGFFRPVVVAALSAAFLALIGLTFQSLSLMQMIVISVIATLIVSGFFLITSFKSRVSIGGARLVAAAGAVTCALAVFAHYAPTASTMNNGEVGVAIDNTGSTASAAGLSNDPRELIVELTGSFSMQGFVGAIFERNTSIVALYLKSGMAATNLYEGTSAILFGFESVNQNGDPIQSGDPVALVKAFQAAGFKVDEELEDDYLMGKLTDGIFPLTFNTDLTPKGYMGGYQNGIFVGSLLFWVVQRALGSGPTEQDIQVIKYLISQGADCNVALSFLNFNRDTLSGSSPYEELLPMMQSCAE